MGSNSFTILAQQAREAGDHVTAALRYGDAAQAYVAAGDVAAATTARVELCQCLQHVASKLARDGQHRNAQRWRGLLSTEVKRLDSALAVHAATTPSATALRLQLPSHPGVFTEHAVLVERALRHALTAWQQAGADAHYRDAHAHQVMALAMHSVQLHVGQACEWARTVACDATAAALLDQALGAVGWIALLDTDTATCWSARILQLSAHVALQRGDETALCRYAADIRKLPQHDPAVQIAKAWIDGIVQHYPTLRGAESKMDYYRALALEMMGDLFDLVPQLDPVEYFLAADAVLERMLAQPTLPDALAALGYARRAALCQKLGGDAAVHAQHAAHAAWKSRSATVVRLAQG